MAKAVYKQKEVHGMGPAKRGFICLLLFVNALSAYSQQSVATLDEAIVRLTGSLADRLPAGTVVALLNFSAPEPAASEYVIEEFNITLANLGRLRVVDRRSLELLQRELNFQMSGEVDEASAQAIGHMLGAQSIISGSLTLVGDAYRMRLQAISVETAQIQYGGTVEVILDRRLANLLRVEPPEELPPPQEPPPPREIPPWTNKWLYIGIRGGGSLGFFTLSDDIEGEVGPASLGLEAGAHLALQIARNLAIQVEALYGQDSFEYTVAQNGKEYKSSFTSNSLTFPALLKLTGRSSRVLFALYGGAYMTIPLGQMDYESDIDAPGSYQFAVPVGVTGGVDFGIKLGPGALFLDARYSHDLGNTSISDDGGTLSVYSRSKVSVSLGYELGLFTKK
jgi:TolB-like protein